MKKTKNGNAVIIVLLIVIICLISIGIYSYFNYTKNSNNRYENLDVTSKEVTDLLFLTRGNNDTTLFYGTDYYNIYYKEDVIKTNALNEDFKKLLAYYTLDKSLKDNSSNATVFKAEDLKKQYITIFGEDVNYKNEDIYCNCPSKIIYISAFDNYVLDGSAGTLILEGYDNKITDARKYKEKIEIYEKVVFYVEDENTGNISYYKDSDFKNKITEISGNEQFKFDDYEKQYNTYKYTFVLKNDLYYFDSVERIK